MSMDKLILTARNFNLTDAIKESVIDRMNKVFSHDENIDSIDVVLEDTTSQKTPTFEARGNLSLHGKHFHVESKEHDMYVAIHKLSDILLRDVRREHRKFAHIRKHS